MIGWVLGGIAVAAFVGFVAFAIWLAHHMGNP